MCWNSLTESSINYVDSPINWQIHFNDPASPVMQGLIDLHHDIFFFLTSIAVFVLCIGARTIYHFNNKKNESAQKYIHGSYIEIAWTTLPCLLLIWIAIPSFALLYSLEEVVDPALTILVIGHQWYWSYEYSDYIATLGFEKYLGGIVFDSYMIAEDDLSHGEFRLLEVDNRVVLPVNTHIRMIITAADVIHSWAIPSLGIKCDAIPGRTNQVPTYIKREGLFYGQCSELCGYGHAFMPIVCEAVSPTHFVGWLASVS